MQRRRKQLEHRLPRVGKAERLQDSTHTTSVANAIDVLREAAGRQLDAVSRDRALALLASAGEREPMVPAMQQLFFSLPVAERPSSAAGRLWAHLNGLYLRLVRARWFRWVVIAVFGVQALVTVLMVAFFGVVGAILLIGHPELASGLQIDTRIDLTDLIGTIGSLASGGFTVVGIVMLWRSRLRAYRAFERS